MDLEEGHLYHIFNQGNNKQKIFYNNNNYVFFLNKVRKQILPYAEIIAWCLMPDHFHLMIYIGTHSKASSRTVGSINRSVGILLSSYTQAINKQENRSGSLFKPHTKAECLTRSDGVVPSFYNTSSGAQINVPLSEKEYPLICFNYIHNNPVKANLVEHPEDWEFSSYRDYCGLRNGNLVNKIRAMEFGLELKQ